MTTTVLSFVAMAVGGGGLLWGLALMLERPRYLAALIVAATGFVSGAIYPVLDRLADGEALTASDMDRYTGASALVALVVFALLAAFVFVWRRLEASTV